MAKVTKEIAGLMNLVEEWEKMAGVRRPRWQVKTRKKAWLYKRPPPT